MMRAALLCLMLAASAAAAPCGNCEGHRVVGPGPVRYPCPVCEGSGEGPDLPAEETAAPASAMPEGPAAAAAEPAPPEAGKPRPVVARVTASARGTASSGPSVSKGSGVLVAASGSQAVVLTAWHVVRGATDAVSVSWPDGSSSPATVIASEDAWDLAALACRRPAAAPVPIAASAAKLGEPLTIAGYGAGPYREQRGACSDYLSPTREHPRQFLELKAAARKGDSGGPIFDERGELAGVLWGQKNGRTYGSSATRLRLFVAGIHSKPEPAAAAATCSTGRCSKR